MVRVIWDSFMSRYGAQSDEAFAVLATQLVPFNHKSLISS